MLKKTLTYTDFDGIERKEDFYFNLTKTEIMEMEMEKTGGLSESMQKIIDSKNVPEIMKVFKSLVLRAYGKKSDDGKLFVKSKEISDEFQSSAAYSDIFMELATNAELAADFFNGIIPSDVAAEIKAQQAKNHAIANSNVIENDINN